MADELVLCVRRGDLEALGLGSPGVSLIASATPAGPTSSSPPTNSPHSKAAELLRLATPRPRTAELERDPRWVQLVAYGVLASPRGVLAYRRARGSGEGRLLGKASVGWGGHLTAGDHTAVCEGDPLAAARCGLYRELVEELNPTDFWCFDLEFVGLVGDDTTPVGRHHIGFVFRVTFDLSHATALRPNGDAAVLGWFPPPEVHRAARQEAWLGAPLEEWTRLLALDTMAPGSFWEQPLGVVPVIEGGVVV